MHIPKTLQNTSIAVAIILIIFVAGEIIYVYLTDRSIKHIASTQTKNTTSTPIPQPVKPASNAPEGVAIDTITSPIAAGSNASIGVLTNAGSVCDINVTYNGIQSSDSGLTSKKADAYGNVMWSWTVESSVPVGSWPIKITCVYNSRSAVYSTNIQVTK